MQKSRAMLTIPGKIPIHVQPIFAIVVLGLSLINGGFQPVGTLMWIGVICFSLLVHEFGHALTAVACGQRASIDLVAFGGVTRRYGRALKSWQEFLIVLNGPLAGFLLCFLSYWILATYENSLSVYMQQLLFISYYANLFWTLLNLLPVQPLDGGQLLRIALEGFFGLKGLKAALFLSFVLSACLSVFFFMTQYMLVGAFFLLFTFEGYRAWKSSLSMTEKDEDRALQHFMKSAEKDFHKGQLSYAQEKLNIVRKQAEKGVLYTNATVLLAQILHMQGHDDQAYMLLHPLESVLAPDVQQLQQQLAYSQKQWEETIRLGNAVYQHQPTHQPALLNAMSHAQLGQARPAVGWLQCAIRNGLPNAQAVLAKKDFDAIRQDPLFVSLGGSSLN